MKKHFFIILFLICCLFLPFSNLNYVSAENTVYARVISANTYLYKTDEMDENNKWFLLEKTYFVKIISTLIDCYKVKYFNITGYVAVDCVDIINGIPSNPYPNNITFNINSSLNTKLRTSTSMTSDANIIGFLPSSDCELNYIAKTYGEESIKNLGSIWYYCYYEYDNNSCIYGYVYAPLTENLTPIPQNTETFSNIIETNNDKTPQNIDEKQNIVIVVLLCLPAVLIVALLVIPFKKKENNNSTNTQKKLKKKSSKKDFYEVD